MLLAHLKKQGMLWHSFGLCKVQKKVKMCTSHCSFLNFLWVEILGTQRPRSGQAIRALLWVQPANVLMQLPHWSPLNLWNTTIIFLPLGKAIRRYKRTTQIVVANWVSSSQTSLNMQEAGSQFWCQTVVLFTLGCKQHANLSMSACCEKKRLCHWACDSFWSKDFSRSSSTQLLLENCAVLRLKTLL